MADNAMTSFTLNEIRGILSDEIRKVREGLTSPVSVNSISNATGKILSSVKLEMEYYRLLGKAPPNIPLLMGTDVEPAPQGEGKSSGPPPR
ncbi:MAG: hypothetical protein Q8Q14_04895 [Gemmatimonadales bacterium]|nr:hypothetical protein [Gemmatimonadales bacterium]